MGIKVLIADDHTVVRDGLHALLRENPEIVVVGHAASGRHAVSQAQSLHPDIVLMDISMPDLNGIIATQQIHTLSPEVGIIVLSMLGTAEHVFRALKAGARGYLLKESAGREVIEAILAVHAGKTYLSQPITNILISDYLQHHEPEGRRGPLERLSQREREILPLVVEGKTSAEIAEILFLSPKTVESYRSRMMRKLGLTDLSSLIRFAIEQGLLL